MKRICYFFELTNERDLTLFIRRQRRMCLRDSTNPPYGERLKPADLNALYGSFGTHLKHQFTGWEAWILSGNPEAAKHLGPGGFLKFDLDNGGIESKLLGCRLFK